MQFQCAFLLIFLGFFIFHSNGLPTDIKVPAQAKNDTTTNDEGKDSDSFPDDDSDMLMEPDEFSHIDIIRSDGQQIYPTTTEYDSGEQDGPTTNTRAAAQNFYPTFFRDVPPLGHSRPYFQAPEGAPSSKLQAPRSLDQSILGSGDFGVIRGGTFYAENEAPFHGEGPNDYGFVFGDDGANNNNGHGRPHADAFVQKFTYPEEQFANFRDFAEINTPADSAFSQFVVVYANKNSTSQTHHANPKNIFEQLELLDREKAQEEKKNRVSKSKSKLAGTKLQRKYKKKSSPKDLDYEPLLALS